MRQHEVDHVLVVFDGLLGYSGDYINKFLWMARIAECIWPDEVKERYFFTPRGESLQLHHETAEPDLKDFVDEEEWLKNTLDKLQRNLADHIKLMEDAWARHYISVAMGFQLTITNLFIELAVRFRDLSQKATALIDAIKATRSELSIIEVDIARTEVLQARDDASAVEYQAKALQKYNAEQQQNQHNRIISTISSWCRRVARVSVVRGFDTDFRWFEDDSRGVDDSRMVAGREPFKPMNAGPDLEAPTRPLTEEEKITRDMKGISHRSGGGEPPSHRGGDGVLKARGELKAEEIKLLNAEMFTSWWEVLENQPSFNMLRGMMVALFVASDAFNGKDSRHELMRALSPAAQEAVVDELMRQHDDVHQEVRDGAVRLEEYIDDDEGIEELTRIRRRVSTKVRDTVRMN
ncbi:hypothetical protein INS49_014380 [Diaporthe citri]|uniref:uncharacterized protein n=1 Tax=Diaporthe citri TaxID=83186 RepID=UPI001C821B2A|nr:uncharacterized protein INS49_014380 [Diaporthe citri]KAG6358496.1 hypothetical protein INS49_014380 [Diaporthe citri]